MDLFFATGGELVKHTGGISKGADSSPQPKQTNQQHCFAYISVVQGQMCMWLTCNKSVKIRK